MPPISISKKQSRRLSVGYKRLAPLRRLSRPKPPLPPPVESLFPRRASLPLELRMEILRFATEEDEEWHDLDTLRALSLVNKASWVLVAPILSKTVNLALVKDDRLEHFAGYLSQLTLRHIRVILAVPSARHSIHFLVHSGAFIAACPHVERISAYAAQGYGIGGWRQHDGIGSELFARLSSYSLFYSDLITSWYPLHPPPTAPVSLMLGNFDPEKLTSLSLTSPGVGFGDSIESFTSVLTRFKNLVHLSLKGVDATPGFHLSELFVLSAPLRSIHLDLSTHEVRAESLLRYFATYSSTLEHLSIFCVMPDTPVGTLHLPKLRHLRRGIPNPSFLLRALLTCPIEVLDLPIPSPPEVEKKRADYQPIFDAFSPTLRLFLPTPSLVDYLPFGLPTGGPETILAQVRASGAVVLWRASEQPPRSGWEDAEVFDRWIRQWRRDKKDAAFLKQEYLNERRMIAEHA
ncbi:hypothetical protein JCM6882_003626 [Rhodosporidiobolus microsporus]